MYNLEHFVRSFSGEKTELVHWAEQELHAAEK